MKNRGGYLMTVDNSLTVDSNTYDNNYIIGDWDRIYYPYVPVNPWYPDFWGNPSTTFTIVTGEIYPTFIKVGDKFTLTIDAPGFGKENDILQVKVQGSTLEVYKNSIKTIYMIPEKLDTDTLEATVEFGQIIITADVKEQSERKSIPVTFRR